ncbi:Sterile alpha motif domain-containing protein [Trichinella pseudospiralis]
MVFNSSIKNRFKDRFNLPRLESDMIFMKAAKSNLIEWTVKDVSNFVAELGFGKEALVFEQNFVDGSSIETVPKNKYFTDNDI